MALDFWLLLAALAAQQPPAPQPFPRPGQQPARPAPQAPAPAQPQPASPPPATTATPPPASEAPPNSSLGVPLYPGAQFLSSFDAGRGQRYFWFGSTASFVEVVAFYRGALKQKGELVFDAPATHEFDVGRFKEESMAFPPGVTVKDFHSEVSQGYPNPKPGGQPGRFPTIIQIVPPQ